ncbi:trypsin-3-like isoform X2 [Rhinatrema bivittatum]|uniref:trypsin-3-like isoform X2 n=1 Tax=Rhinatrema bivittatum TaxID=194408 RepID=UPI00112D6876|nr:trypsin-3-like isoform X2 [Rhinatrema bivittatum]
MSQEEEHHHGESFQSRQSLCFLSWNEPIILIIANKKSQKSCVESTPLSVHEWVKDASFGDKVPIHGQLRGGGLCNLQRIIGGYVVAPYSSKYLVSLKRNTGLHFCGGSLVSRNWVLTAAHCRTELKEMLIVAGEHSLSTFEGTEQIFRPTKMVTHPDYSSVSKNADIMLIKLNRPALYNAFVSVVPLPMQGAAMSEGRFCQTLGWGYTSAIGGKTSDTLRSVKLPIVSMWKCNSTASYAGHITSNMICAGFSIGGKDACQGDSGGPLVCDGRLFGIVSWGNSCASPRYPGVYTAVASFQTWIYKIIG